MSQNAHEISFYNHLRYSSYKKSFFLPPTNLHLFLHLYIKNNCHDTETLESLEVLKTLIWWENANESNLNDSVDQTVEEERRLLIAPLQSIKS